MADRRRVTAENCPFCSAGKAEPHCPSSLCDLFRCKGKHCRRVWRRPGPTMRRVDRGLTLQRCQLRLAVNEPEHEETAQRVISRTKACGERKRRIIVIDPHGGEHLYQICDHCDRPPASRAVA